jgi:PAS domain S-box-containing protein
MEFQPRAKRHRRSKKRSSPSGVASERLTFPTESSLSLSCTLDLAGVVLAVSPTGAACLDYSAEALLQTPVFRLFHPEDQPSLQSTITALAQNPAQVVCKHLRLLKRDGSSTEVKVTTQALQGIGLHSVLLLTCESHQQRQERMPAHTPPSASRTATSIADASGEERWQLMQSFLGKLLDYAPTPIYITTAEQRLCLVNRAWKSVSNLGREEAIDRFLEELFPPAVAQQFKAVNQQVLDSGCVITTEEFIDTPEGRRYFHTIKFPLYDTREQIEAVGGISIEITDRKQMETALQAKEEQLRLALDFTHIGLWDWHIASDRLIWNENAARLLGRPLDQLEVNASAWSDCIHPEDRDRIWQLGNAALQNHSVYEAEYRIVWTDGSVHWLLGRGRGIYDQSGQATRMIGCIIDITDRKQIEEALQESENRFRSIFEQAAVGLAYTGLDSQYQMVNQKLCEITGYTREELLFLGFEDISHPDDIELNRACVTRLRAGEIPTFSLEKRYVRKDGSTIWVNVTVSLIYQPSGQPNCTVAVIEDITARKHVEAALHESEERRKLAIQGSNDGIWDWNIKTNENFSSTRCKTMLGYEDHEFENTYEAWTTYIHPEDFERVMEAITAHLSRQTPYYSIEYRLKCKDGSYKWILTRGQALWDEQGTPIRMVGSQVDISDRKQAEIALQTSQAKLSAILDNAIAAIFSVRIFPDGSKEYEYFSCGVQSVYGYSAEEFAADIPLWQSRVLPEDWQTVILPVIDDIFAGRSTTLEYRFQRKDGSISWIRESSLPRRDMATDCWVVTFVGIDITARKRAEETISASEERFRTLVSNIPGAVYRCAYDPDWTMEFISDAIEAISGYPASDFIDSQVRTFISIIHPEDQPSPSWGAQEILVERCPFIAEYRIICADGTVRWIYEKGQAICAEDGSVLWLDGVMFDVTERKQAEEALRRSEERWHLVLNGNNDGIWDWNLKTDEAFYSTQWKTILGYEEDEITNHHDEWAKRVHPDDIDRVLQSDFAHLNRITPRSVSEFRMQCKDGSYRWILCRAVALWDEQGQPIRMLGSHRDITDRKQAEIELERAKEAAEAASRAKTEFLSRMSHELRTPLTAILGFAELIARGPLSQEHQEHLAIISHSGTHLLNLINDVLEMSKIEAGEVTLDETSFDFYYLLENIEKLLNLRATDKGLELIFERSTEVPRYIQADENKLRQILINLLGNAIKFTHSGRVILRVKLENQPCENDSKLSHGSSPIYNRLYFEIEDTGVGVAPDEIGKLFATFSQTRAGRQAQGGTGLGLAISHQFIQLMGGEISIQSQEGQGTLFVFKVPFKVAEAALFQQPRSSDRLVIGLAPGQPLYRILIVDDQSETRKILVKLLAPLGFEVQEAVNGQEAIACWQCWRPHLIWMDMQMPIMDGCEATQQLRLKEKNSAREKAALSTQPSTLTAFSVPPAKIIALTATAFEEQRATVLAAGCDDFVTKPFRSVVILEKLAEHLGVRYAYADEQSRTNTPFAEATAHQAIQPLTPPDLAVMPAEWLAQFQVEAAMLNLDECLKLIEQVPEVHDSLAQALTKLVSNFRFDVLVDLLQSL